MDASLRKMGSHLWLGYGDPCLLLPVLTQLSGATVLYTNRGYTYCSLPEGAYVTCPNVGHLPHEEAAAAFNKDSLTFLNRK